ncbi:Xylanase inhibitor, C-terminal [Dillenia turbinata]|uniref:Xylanase inhibitor, C-terminal n=1 Tax=Dillenia turbinata TaxID=194707 RepID=A0AAN8UQN7_9MAGN
MLFSKLYDVIYYRKGLPTLQGQADGIIGLGHSEVSILSQLASSEEIPKIFSHCLMGEGFGGGVLLFGEILEPDLIYTPLVSSRKKNKEALKSVDGNFNWPKAIQGLTIGTRTRSHYGVDVEGIEINGQVLPIDPKVFKSSRYRGAIFDSGSTFVSLIDDAYVPFARNVSSYKYSSGNWSGSFYLSFHHDNDFYCIQSFLKINEGQTLCIIKVKSALSHLVPVSDLEGDLCYESSTSKPEDFPIISFKFAANAIIHLRPEDYLVEGIAGLVLIRCIGIRKTVIRGATIIGGLDCKLLHSRGSFPLTLCFVDVYAF